MKILLAVDGSNPSEAAVQAVATRPWPPSREEGAVMNPLIELERHDQAVWLDFVDRALVLSGELRRLVEDDGLRGLTSIPSISERAFAGEEYADGIRELAASSRSAKDLYEQLAVRDIADAADVLRSVHVGTGGRDGFACLEVSPRFAHDTQGTIDEARRLFGALGRPNVMIRVPGTDEGVPAIEQLTAEGLNVNVTLLFSRDTYERVAQAYLAGLRRRVARELDVSRIASVASFFVSRIDTAVDGLLATRIAAAPTASARLALQALLGKAAIANARLAYARSRALFGGADWEALASRGARPQRLLWASTGTKNPAYRDVLYVEELIGADTVVTVPKATLAAFRQHGVVRASLAESVDEAHAALDSLARAGIDLADVTSRLLDEGVAAFAASFDKLLASLERARLAPAASGERGSEKGGERGRTSAPSP